MVELVTLVMSQDSLAIETVIDKLSSVIDAKLILFHCSISDDELIERFFNKLRKFVNLPFIGVRVSATMTNKGFFEDSIVMCILSGNFEVDLYQEISIFESSDDTVKTIVSNLAENELCLMYAACLYPEGVQLDYILRKTHIKKPNIQFFGMISSAPQLVFSNKGILKNGIVYCVIKGVNSSHNFLSGIKVQGDDGYMVTKATNFFIQEIDGKNAVTVYCGMKHMRPYLINTVVSMVTKPDVHKVMQLLSKTNERLYEVILRSTVDFLGVELETGVFEPKFILNLDEQKSEWLTQSFTPEGTMLKWLDVKAENLIKQYEKISQFNKGTCLLMHECAYRLFYMNLRKKDIEKKGKKIKKPFMLSFGYGELGSTLPYSNENVVHGGLMQVLGFD